MPVADSLSTWATMVLMLPFGILLAMTIFGVDEKLAAPTGRRPVRVRFCEVGPDGRGDLADPDGHLLKRRIPDSAPTVDPGAQGPEPACNGRRGT